MLESEIQVNQFLVRYCRVLSGDIAEERLAEQPLPGVNHPAWVLGHLAFSADRADAHAECGNFKEAVRLEQRALELGYPDASATGNARGRLKLYEVGRPYRERGDSTPAVVGQQEGPCVELLRGPRVGGTLRRCDLSPDPGAV
jgi:hypothetical protein